ncbi:MAG: GHKL domain-containing protein [Lachnospiraceae bacterium]|nr:GHKL domain-containing protein [Lachnospiraceae bacterium]
MIQKLRKKFIIIAMLSMFIVLAVIVGTMNLANYVSMTVRADHLLKILVENDGKFPEMFMGRKVMSEDASATGESDGTDPGSRPPALPDGKEFGSKPPEPAGTGSQKGDFRKEKKFFSDETPYETRFFSVRYNPLDETACTSYTGHIASVSEEEAKEYAYAAVKRFRKFAKFRGYDGNYRYMVSTDENGGRLVVFLDVSKEKKNVKNVLVNSLIMSGIGMFAVFVLVWIFSKKVFRPVEESDLRQKRFITDASHELKTPLTIISANVEVLEMESEENEWTGSIKHQVDRMNTLVEQMVTLTRLDEQNKPERVDFSLSDAVRETAETYLPVAAGKNQKLEIEVSDGLMFCGDEAKIRQMTGLLVENATKYTTDAEGNEGGEIKVSLSGKGKKNLLVVRNTVSGMQPGKKDELFERFYRPDESRNSKKGGSGIGLSIVKSVAEAHGGKVSAFSKDGKTIQFEVLL